jgi:hypothetical protein
VHAPSEETPYRCPGEMKDFSRFLNNPARKPRFVTINAPSGPRTTRNNNQNHLNNMNTITQNALRSAALVAVLLSLSATVRASEPSVKPVDRACQIMDASGSVPIVNIGPDVRVGSSPAAVSEAVGHADRVLSNGTWIFYKNFYVDQSSAHGSLAVSFENGRVASLRIVSPVKLYALIEHPESSEQVAVVAALR